MDREETIYRQDVLDLAKKGVLISNGSYKSVCMAINNIPSVNPVKTGRWIGHREHCENLEVVPSGLGAYEWCSNCDCGIDVREWHRNNYNYCPNCGAWMIETQESEVQE